MLGIRYLAIGLVSLSLFIASSALGATALYQGQWVSESFGNDAVGGPTESANFSILGNPLGTLCNPNAPRCKFDSTPVDSGATSAWRSVVAGSRSMSAG